MKLVADSSVILDFLDGVIENPYEIILPYRIISVSPVAFHEVLRAYPFEDHANLLKSLKRELLPPPTIEHWIESARIMRKLYPQRKQQNVARMQNDILIALAAREIKAPLWSRDADFGLICEQLGIGFIKN